MEIALVFMVAGISSRFQGKIKAFAEIGPNQESLIEYSLNQALPSGFSKIIFIVGNKTHQPFKEKFGNEYNNLPIQYIFQTYLPEKRDKPWGTVDAVSTLQGIIDTPFVLANGDDLYGKTSFETLVHHLKSEDSSATIALPLKQMLPKEGNVNRGIFEIDKEHYIKDIKEVLNIDSKNLSISNLTENSLTNTNLFALYPETVNQLSEILRKFKEKNKESRTAECLLPVELSNLIKLGALKMKLYKSQEKWFGITNPGDELLIKAELSKTN